LIKIKQKKKKKVKMVSSGGFLRDFCGVFRVKRVEGEDCKGRVDRSGYALTAIFALQLQNPRLGRTTCSCLVEAIQILSTIYCQIAKNTGLSVPD